MIGYLPPSRLAPVFAPSLGLKCDGSGEQVVKPLDQRRAGVCDADPKRVAWAVSLRARLGDPDGSVAVEHACDIGALREVKRQVAFYAERPR